MLRNNCLDDPDLGLDPDGPAPEVHQQVEVPDTLCSLDTAKRQHFDGLDLCC